MVNNYSRNKGESEKEYIHRICQMKDVLGWTWQEIADLLNCELNWKLSKDAYRFRNKNYKEEPKSNIEQLSIFDLEETAEETETTLDDLLLEMKKERVKISDERAQNNAIIRRIAREETLLEIAKEAVKDISKNIPLKNPPAIRLESLVKEGLLLLSDWHYGIDIKNCFNHYDPDVARKRVQELRDKVAQIVVDEAITKLTIINLGDMISGRIHSTIRINNRIDVITQCIEVSEILSEFINSLSEYCYIDYYDTSDNHSRLEPNLKESLDQESLTRIIHEFLVLRLEKNKHVNIYKNEVSDDIVTFNIMGHNIAAVHGDKDKPTKVIDNLTMMTERHYDLICTAHLHHWNSDEKNFTRRIGNGSLMGTDDFSFNLRLTSNPSQTFVVVTEKSVTDSIHIIDLE